MGELQLSLQEAVLFPPKKETHKQVIIKLEAYNQETLAKVSDSLQIVTQHTIPNLKEPTTTEHLRKRLVQDLGVIFCFHVAAV